MSRFAPVITRAARRLLVLALDAAGLTLIVYAAWTYSQALGFLVAGVIALGVAVVLTPSDRGSGQRDGDGTGEAET